MTRIRPFKCTFVFAALTAVTLSCGDFVRSCPMRPNTSARDSRITVAVAEPFQCRYTVEQVGNFIYFLADLEAPAAWYVGKPVTHRLRNNLGQDIVNATTLLWQSGPQCTQSACQLVEANFPGATGTEVNGHYRDTYFADGPVLAGNGHLEVDFDGVVGAMANIVGPSSVNGAVGLWQASVIGDTQSYQYQWYLDGAAVAGATQRSYVGPLGESGSHLIRSIATLMDQTKDTVTVSVSNTMIAGVDGPTYLYPNEGGTWFASADGARLPLAACQWQIDFVAEPGTNCSVSRSFSVPNSQHHVVVTVTDGRGLQATSPTKFVQILDPGGGWSPLPPDFKDRPGRERSRTTRSERQAPKTP